MSSRVQIKGFEWTFEIFNPDGSVASSDTRCNLIPDAGLDFLLRAPFGDTSQVATFYLGLFRGNYMPSNTSKASDIPGNMNEFIDYDELTRPEWRRRLSGISTLDNVDSKAEFTVNQDRDLYGAFLVSEASKGAGNGLLLSCLRWPSPKSVTAGQTIRLSGGITYTSTNII